MTAKELKRSLDEKLKAKNIDWGKAHDFILNSFVAAVFTKPFVLLAGPTGHGKTSLARAFGEVLKGNGGNYAFLPVKPEWTDSTDIWGKSIFDPHNNAWEFKSTGLYEIIKLAREKWLCSKGVRIAVEDTEIESFCKESFFPCFSSIFYEQWFIPQYCVILDEMNLARPEYYLADILSVMETFEPGELFTSKKLELNLPGLGDSEISLPRNLSFIGTLNIDESTYQLSPRVLDRAFVIWVEREEDGT